MHPSDNFVFNVAWPFIVDGSPLIILLAPLFVLAFTWNDRFWGADNQKGDAKLLVLLTAILAWITAGPYAVVAVFAWALYRALSFKGGTGAPETEEQREGTRRRHLIIVPPMLVIAFFHGGQFTVVQGVLGAGLAFLLFMGYAEYATKIAINYGNLAMRARVTGESLGKFNMKLERDRGLVFGIAFAVWLAGAWLLHLLPY